jgi:hypothetical protein
VVSEDVRWIAPAASPKRCTTRGMVCAYTNYKHLFAAGEHPRSCIFIPRCYKRCRDGPLRGASRRGSGGTGAGLCRILDLNFREFIFHELG